MGGDLPGDDRAIRMSPKESIRASWEIGMKNRDLSRREKRMVEDAITRMCRALGVSETDAELRQTAWVEILSVYRNDPKGFQGDSMQGWRRAYDVAGNAILKEVHCCQQQIYGQISLDKPISGDTEATLLQLLHSPSGNFENGVCLRDYLSRQPLDVQRTARAMIAGEPLSQLQFCYQWTWDYTLQTLDDLRAAMRAYQQI